MSDKRGAFGTLFVYADETNVRPGHWDPDGDCQIALVPIEAETAFNIVGTTDELAKFVTDLASVVRELTAREMAVTA